MALKISLFTQQNAFVNSQNIPPTYPSWVDNTCVPAWIQHFQWILPEDKLFWD